MPDPRTRLALAVTGRTCSSSNEIKMLASLVPEAFLAKAAVTASEAGMSKYAALLLAVLTVRDVELLAKVFLRAVPDAGTLRRYVGFLRSGRVGRRSFGTRPKKLVQDWLNAQPAGLLRVEAFQHRPSLADIVRWTHPKPVDREHSVVYAWMTGRPTSVRDLPAVPPNGGVNGPDAPDVIGSTGQSPERLTPPVRRRERSISRVEGIEL